MRKLKKLAIWALVLSMVLSLFAGLSLTAHAEGTLSATYPEATELLTNIGFMDNKEKAWTDYITASEANAVLKKVYDSAGFAAPWEDIPEADVISGADFVAYAMKTCGWDAIWATYFNLTKGVVGYDPAAALTREQAAQIVRNLFTVGTFYEKTLKTKGEEGKLMIGIDVSYDAFGRPSVQWYKDGVAVTGVYADKPVAVVNGGVPTNYVLDMIGATATFAGAGHHAYMKISDNGAAFPDDYTLYYQGGFGPFMSFGYTIEIYDTYKYTAFDGHGVKSYTVIATSLNYLAEVTTFNDTKFLGLYGQDNGTTYGWWSAAVASCPAINSAEDGFYIAYFNNGAVGSFYKATKLVGTLDAYDPANSILTISGTPRMFTPLFKYGRYFLLDIDGYAAYNSNLGKTFAFYLDRMGNVVGMGCTECAFGKPTDQNGVEGTHSSECPNCHRIATADHTYPETWTLSEGNATHEHVCTACGGGAVKEAHNLGESWTYLNKTYHYRDCPDCDYSEVVAHDTELRGFVEATILAGGYSGDLYCKVCGELLEEGHATDKLDHDHAPEEPVKENVVPATCETDGSYDLVTYCSLCHEAISTEHKTEEALGHDWEETGRTDATETEDGEIRYVCRHDAQHTKTEVILSKQNAKIDYPEAVELMKASGLMDATNNAWKQKLTGAEANTLLQALYDGPGFINPWSPGLNVEGTVTGADFIHKAIYTLGYSYWEDQLWIDFFHLTRGLAAYDAGAELTREEAAQITLNVLKAAPQYNTAGIKANDGNIGLQLVKADEDELHRPSYKWQKNSADITAVYKDTPIVTLEGGKSWDDVLDALGLTDTFAQVMEHGFFRFSENGDGFSDYVLEYHGTPDPVWKTSDWTLEFYDNYYKHTAIFPGNGVEFTCKAYDVIGIGESGQGGQEELPEVNWNTSYPEAAELVTKTRLMDADKSWKENLSADEANRVLQALYDAPHFAAEWHPGFTSDDQVTGSAFISKALVTIGWNYSNDEIFSVYNHLKKGLLSGYISSKLLTREQAAQIVLNVLKSIPTYNPDVLKANDPELNLRLVKTGVDAYNRPTYKWQRNGLDITGSYADQPLATMKGGVSWTEILNAVGDIGAVNFPASFRWSENGGEFSAYEDHIHPDYNLFKTADWNLEIYADYNPAHQGLGYEIVCYGGEPLKVNDTEWYGEGDAVMRCPIPLSEFVGVTMDGRLLDPENYTATEGSTIITIKEEYLNTLEPGSHSVCLVFRTGAAYATLAVKGEVVDTGTSYPEAVELMTNCGFMDGADKDWKKYLTGAEANKLLNMLYDGPGFVADWDPGYAEDLDRISAGSFISKALVTIGWNYNNDILFCYYNHLTKGVLPEDYAWDKALTREVAAQIVLNTLKTIPTYNQSSLKANDPGIALSLVQTGEDNYHRPYYKWVRYGEDMTSSYPDTPILASQGGLRWTDILISVGDCGAINLPASFRWSETGGAFTRYVDKVHPDFTVFKNPNWAVEIYLDYSTEHAGYGYNIVTYVGTVDPIHPATGDNAISIWIPIAAMAASAAAAAYILISRKKRKENA